MSISMEQIDEMRKRTNCSYQEAKELLQKHNGDLIDAIIDFETKHGPKTKNISFDKNRRFGQKLKELIKKGFVTRFIIEKEGSIILNIPVNILIIAMLITMPVFWLYIIFFVALYIMGYKVRIKKEEGQELDINEIVDGIGSKVKTCAEQMREKPVSKENADNKSQAFDETAKKDDHRKEDSYNEVTVE